MVVSKTYTHARGSVEATPLYPKLNLWFIGVG